MVALPSTISEESRISYYGWVVVGMALLANLVAFGLVYSFGIFLKPLASEYGWSRSVTAGAFGFYGILHTLLAPFAGRLCDQFGPRLVLTIAGFCLGLPMILMGYTIRYGSFMFIMAFFSPLGLPGNMFRSCQQFRSGSRRKEDFRLG